MDGVAGLLPLLTPKSPPISPLAGQKKNVLLISWILYVIILFILSLAPLCVFPCVTSNTTLLYLNQVSETHYTHLNINTRQQ